jgi:hypothetical protein
LNHFLLYWKPETVLVDQNQPVLTYVASQQLDKVRVGDVLWVVTSEESDDLILIGRLKVDRIVGQVEAEAIMGHKNLWKADSYAICDHPEEKMSLDISRWARSLRFEGGVDRLPEGFSGQHLQTMRSLDFSSARMLEKLLEQAEAERAEDKGNG